MFLSLCFSYVFIHACVSIVSGVHICHLLSVLCYVWRRLSCYGLDPGTAFLSKAVVSQSYISVLTS